PSAPGNTFSPVSTHPSSAISAPSTFPRRTPRTWCLQSADNDHHGPRSKHGRMSEAISAFSRPRRDPWVATYALLEAEIGHDVSAFIFDHVGTLRALERRLGVFIAERRGFLVIGFGGACILRPAAPALCKCAHALQGARMILRRRLFEQRARRDVILRSADALRDHQAELILRFRRIRFRRFRQQGSGLDGLRRCAAALVEGREIGGAAGIAARSRALE